MAAHDNLRGQCASCHQPWHGPASDRCVACHGDIVDVNPHGGYDVTSDSGLIDGRTLHYLTRDNEITCLSCHTEHRGRVVDLNTTATFNCAWCHKHPSIDGVDEHTRPIMKRGMTTQPAFVQPFNHFEHKLLIASHYAADTRRLQMRIVPCRTADAAAQARPDEFSTGSGCAGSGCHLAPQDSFMQMPASIGPAPRDDCVLAELSSHEYGLRAFGGPSRDVLARPVISRCRPARRPMMPTRSRSRIASNATHISRPPPAAGVRSARRDDQLAKHWHRLAAAPIASGNSVTACGQCHLFHTHGPLMKKDFVGTRRRRCRTLSLI